MSWFTNKQLLYRAEHASLRRELLARAIGIHPNKHPLIIDATAGTGRDSFILAALGYHVIMLERSALIYARLEDAMEEAWANPATASIISRLQLIHADACYWLPLQENRPDVIYLDPMFAPRQKSAAVKKDMAMLQQIVGEDKDVDDLLKIALTCAKQRVVVKKATSAPASGDLAPSFVLGGSRSARFDVYIL